MRIVPGTRRSDDDVEPRRAQQDRVKPQSKADASKAEAPPKPRSRTSTSCVPWSELMMRTLGINVLQCPVCQATMLLLAVITKREVIDRVLTHVNVPREPRCSAPRLGLIGTVGGRPFFPLRGRTWGYEAAFCTDR